MLLTFFGAFLGALLSLLVGIAIEYQRKPKLSIAIEEPAIVQSYENAPAKTARFLRVVVTNRAMPRHLTWLGRSAAQQCSGHISFHHLDDGAPILSKPMPIRWAASEEPISFQIVENRVVSMLDPAKYNAGFRRDCFPGIPEPADVVVRFDNEDDCYGWSNENYLPHKGWRNPEFRLPKGRYLVAVVIRSSGEDASKVLKLENSVGAQHFRLMEASPADVAKVEQHA